MSTEGYVATIYMLIGLVHLAVFAVRRQRDRDYGNPDLAFAVTFAWPVTDALWLMERGRCRRR